MSIELAGPVLAATHVAAALLGAFSGILITRIRSVREVITHEEHDHMPTPHEPDDHPHPAVVRRSLRDRVKGKGPTPGAIALFLILGGLMTIAFAVQQSTFQSDAKERDACTERWGTDLVTTFENRFKATKKLETAQKARDDALDAIILAVIASEDLPRAEAEKAFAAALSAFATAKADLVTVEKAVDTARRNNAYPKLQCDDTGLQEDADREGDEPSDDPS
jgi:hypothetical protein